MVHPWFVGTDRRKMPRTPRFHCTWQSSTTAYFKNNHFSNQSGKPKKTFQQAQEGNFQLVEYVQLLIVEMWLWGETLTFRKICRLHYTAITNSFKCTVPSTHDSNTHPWNHLTTLPPFCATVMKSGNLNFLEPSGPSRPVTGLIFYMFWPSVATMGEFTYLGGRY